MDLSVLSAISRRYFRLYLKNACVLRALAFLSGGLWNICVTAPSFCVFSFFVLGGVSSCGLFTWVNIWCKNSIRSILSSGDVFNVDTKASPTILEAVYGDQCLNAWWCLKIWGLFIVGGDFLSAFYIVLGMQQAWIGFGKITLEGDDQLLCRERFIEGCCSGLVSLDQICCYH